MNSKSILSLHVGSCMDVLFCYQYFFSIMYLTIYFNYVLKLFCISSLVLFILFDTIFLTVKELKMLLITL